MSESKPKVDVKVVKMSDPVATNIMNIAKADMPLAVNDDTANNVEWITPPLAMLGLRALADESTIVPQCRTAYKTNIAGFGISVQYKEDYEKETDEMIKEFEYAQGILECLNMDKDIKEVFEDLIELRETFGIAYLEVIRDVSGNVVQVELIKDVETINKTVEQSEAQDVPFFYNGEKKSRKKKFCKYRQEKNGKTVFFKEIGDPRMMDAKTGEYLSEGNKCKLAANEILEFVIGTRDYGMPRWFGQILNLDGSRKAEELNYRYFINGRHTPLAIVLSGGTLSDDSYTKLQEYVNSIQGENGQHAFLLLEVEDDSDNNFENGQKPTVEIKDLASILQNDELFQNYIDNGRRKVQSSFRLPDVYVGYTQDFNRATAQAAIEITEQQVFIPERKSLAWQINNKLLADYNFKYVEVVFNDPDLSNIEDLSKILAVCSAAGGLTPNKSKEILYKQLGEISEDYEDEWGDIPLAYAKTQNNSNNSQSVPVQLDTTIKKAAVAGDDEIVSVLKEVRKALNALSEVV